MKHRKKILIIIGCIIILSNIPPISALIQISVDERYYRYSNYNGTMTFTQFMSRNFEMMKNRHNSCLLARPNLKDKQVYRLFTKNPFAFWRWRLYFFDERYKLPYKDWKEIEKVRVAENVKIIDGCNAEF
ncbi:hypothetical protein [Pedobacter frigoris]|uniref:hypothetical protein n=1 Tax=Pedobacter frigoris TaxID=2571272 RepID=UPI002930CDFD|nr:hypothetical protein [Pedobacter frigoris]